MNSEEIQSLIEQLKAQGLDEDQIMNIFFQTFLQGKMDRKDLETLADAMGYELTDEFKNDPTPDPIALGPTEGAEEGAEGLTKEQVEDAKEIEPGETAEEFKEKIEGDNAEENEEASEPEEESEEEESETETETEEGEGKEEETEDEGDDEDWAEAQKLFKI